MAVGVVDRLELVQIKEHQGHAATVALRGNQGLLQAIVEQHSVRQVSQCVVEGQVLDLVFCRFSGRDVGEGADIVGDVSLVVLHGRDAKPLGINFTALAFVPDLALP